MKIARQLGYVSLLSLASLFILPSITEAGSRVRKCYPISHDSDGDGYTAIGAPEKVLPVPDLHCLDGYVRRTGDCDDDNPWIHPRRDEIPFNGIDEDCNDHPDESGPVYWAEGNNNTTDSFTLRWRIKSELLLSNAHNLWVMVEYSPLRESTRVYVTDKMRLSGITREDPEFEISLDGLEETTVYRARVWFYTMNYGSIIFGQASPPSFYNIGPHPGISDWYYTTTDGETKKSKVRTKMLLKAFKQVDDSSRGFVGYRGLFRRDGMRYRASPNERWCTEFYAWVAAPYLKGIGSTDSVDWMANYFRAYFYKDALYDGSSVLSVARRGDWLGIDTNDDGKKNHSSIFLAVDESYPDSPTIWSVDGNLPNEVVVKKHDLSSIKNVGHIMYRHLK